MSFTSEDFKSELEKIFASARENNEPYVDVKSGDLHRRVGGYPGRNHRMPVCCKVMKHNMKLTDQILQQPPSGQGATLIIRYNLPK